ncbi:hypothetical protein IFR05_001924 [Cadophora sp. M221]|nr:hypothetical protein IFR05_001924 [Cadophora sp. M221]
MAGPLEESLDEVHILVDAILSLSGDLIPNPNHVKPSASSTASTKIQPGNALITHPPSQFDLRQNNPQDCQNLIIASVDRATVEISRTIIALNASFSQQLQEASISASNGIKAAQDSASSSIGIVVKSADIATSSASFSLTIANRQVVSATSALADFSLSSSSDVASLSSSLSLLQASLSSVQASASNAIAAAQAALASATGSAAAQASSLLASANANLPPSVTQSSSNRPLPSFQSPSNTTLTPAQIAGIAIGAAAASVLLSLGIYFAILRMRRRDRDSYLDEKYPPRSPKELPSRLSSIPRTGNGVTLKFNPPKSSNAPRPSRSALRTKVRTSIEPPLIPQMNRAETQHVTFGDYNQQTALPTSPVWPLRTPTMDMLEQKNTSPALTHWPLQAPFIEQSVSTAPKGFSTYALPKTRDQVVWSQYDRAREDEIVTNPFSDRLELPIEEQVPSKPHESPSEEVTKIRDSMKSRFDNQEFDFGIPKDPFNELASDDQEVPEVDNPFRDTQDEVVDETWDEFNYSLVDKFITQGSQIVEDVGPGHAQEEERQHINTKLAKPTNSYRERVESPSQLSRSQPHLATLPEAADILEKPKVKTILRANTTSLATGRENDILDQPAFLQNYNPPMPEVEKIVPPPPRRRPSLGSIRPLRKMLPPRQKTVSPQRRRDVSGDEKSRSTSQAESSSTRLQMEILSRNLKSGASQQPEVLLPVSIPEGYLRKKDISPLWQNPVIVDILTEATISQAENNSGISSQDGVEALQDHQFGEIKDDEYKVPSGPDEAEETESEDRQHRGRSMLRTSDIIEARLSLKSQMKEKWKSSEALPNCLSALLQPKKDISNPSVSEMDLIQDRKEELDTDTMKSPLRRNPVDFSTILKIPKIPMTGFIPRSKTLPPLRKSIMERNAMKRRSRSLSPTRLPPSNKFLHLNTDPAPITREDSPLRRNPSHPLLTPSNRISRKLSPNPLLDSSLLPPPPPIPGEASPLLNPSQPTNATPSPHTNESKSNPQPPKPPKTARNGIFAYNLSKFQDLAKLDPVDSLVASTEVTQRAMRGIYIPGSLREEAVRGVSRSRERR